MSDKGKAKYVRERLAEFQTLYPEGLIERYGVDAVWDAIQAVASKGAKNPGAWVRKHLDDMERLPDEPTDAEPVDTEESADTRDLGLGDHRKAQVALFGVMGNVARFTLEDHLKAVTQPKPWDTRSLETRRLTYADAQQREYLRRRPAQDGRQEAEYQAMIDRVGSAKPEGETWAERYWREHPEALTAQQADHERQLAREKGEQTWS